jgi:hypothetical protein
MFRKRPAACRRVKRKDDKSPVFGLAVRVVEA